MSLRQKLLLMFSLTITASVALVGITVSYRVRSVFEKMDRERTGAFVAQFRHEFQRQADELAASLDRMAASERLNRTAFDVTQGGDPAIYVTEAASLAQEYRLDFLEIVGPDGNIISSAQWPARFGYKEPESTNGNRATFLKQEDLSDGGSQIGIFAVRLVRGVDTPVSLVGGTRLDKEFLADLPAPSGSQVYLYRNFGSGFDPHNLTSTGGAVPNAALFQRLVDSARSAGQDQNGIVYLTANREDSVYVSAIPLKAENGSVAAVLLVTNSRRGLVEVQKHIKAIAYGVAGVGICIAIVASLWIAGRVFRPIERLALAAEAVASGEWNTQVPISSKDEVGVLAESFNRMTAQLLEQRERLVQTERVAAWRELARRLAHELKNPLFPLQLTVENMTRARQLSPGEFEEVFEEGTATLMAEIGNLKTIIGRFSDFSKMPKPQLQEFDLREVLDRIVALHQPVLAAKEKPISLKLDMPSEEVPVVADPELLHRALSNLILNAIDAMPEGGSLTLSAKTKKGTVLIQVADTGTGISPEECERLFTPYYTTKEYGTGLGLAIVQSVIADHGGSIAVASKPGAGTTFTIEIPVSSPASPEDKA